jgi:transcription elongation factor Elf1
MAMETVYSYATECPCCGHKMDSVSGLNTETKPKPGDCTVCIRCGAICTFDNNMAMQLAINVTGASWVDARKAQRKIRELRGLPVNEKANG